MANILSISNLTKKFGGLTAVRSCSLDLQENRIFGLIGPNGSGKTTLFNLITGVYKPDSGEVHFKGKKITALQPYEIAHRGISRTFQIVDVFPKLTTMENMMVPLQKINEEGKQRAFELLDFAGLADLRYEYAGNLSFGQQKLLEFARVMMLDPQLILLDEPAAGINPIMQNKLMRRIKELRDAGKTFLVIEHHMRFVMDLCENIFVLSHGEKIAEGAPGDIRNNGKVIEAYFGKTR